MILAGAPLLLTLLPIPLPPTVAVVVCFGVALAVLATFTEVPAVPKGILLRVGVEIISGLAMAGFFALLF